MLRCIRFATQLNFYIEDETFDALCDNRERISIISRERINEELNKILLSPIPSKGFIELDRCGLLELIFPQLTALQGVETRNGYGHKEMFYHTLGYSTMWQGERQPVVALGRSAARHRQTQNQTVGPRAEMDLP